MEHLRRMALLKKNKEKSGRNIRNARKRGRNATEEHLANANDLKLSTFTRFEFIYFCDNI